MPPIFAGSSRNLTAVIGSPPLQSKAPQMAVHAPPHIRIRFAATVLSAVCAFHAVAHAESAAPDTVSLSKSTITWSTVKHATDAETDVDGSLDKKIIVDRTFKTHVLENRYLKVTMLPNSAGEFCPSFTSRPVTNSFIAPKSACPTGSKATISITTG